MAESAFEKALAVEMKGAERDYAASAWELNNLTTYADLGRHPTSEQIDAELKRLQEVKRDAR